MVQIVLLVLKIIGILLASVLGLLLALVLIVLFVPIRYKLKAEYEEDLKAEARITWLLRIISFTAEYGMEDVISADGAKEDSDWDLNFRMRLRIFGKILFDSSKGEEESAEKVRAAEQKRKFSFLKKRSLDRAARKTEEIPVRKPAKKEELKEVKPEILLEERFEAEKESEPKANSVLNTRTAEEAEPVRKEAVRISKAAAEAVTGEEAAYEKEIVPEKETVYGKEIVSEKEAIQEKEAFPEKEAIPEKKGIVRFFKETGRRIKSFMAKLKAMARSVEEKLKNIHLFFSNLSDKYRLIQLFFQDEKNKLGLKYGFENVKGLLRHIRPRKVRAYLEFGTGDPCQTGQLLGVAAALMGIYRDSVQIIPDFENEVLKGNFYCKGRIRAIVLLVIGIRVIRNRNIKTLINNFQTLKEEF